VETSVDERRANAGKDGDYLAEAIKCRVLTLIPEGQLPIPVDLIAQHCAGSMLVVWTASLHVDGSTPAPPPPKPTIIDSFTALELQAAVASIATKRKFFMSVAFRNDHAHASRGAQGAKFARSTGERASDRGQGGSRPRLARHGRRARWRR